MKYLSTILISFALLLLHDPQISCAQEDTTDLGVYDEEAYQNAFDVLRARGAVANTTAITTVATNTTVVNPNDATVNPNDATVNPNNANKNPNNAINYKNDATINPNNANNRPNNFDHMR